MVVHNGIVENFRELREELEASGVGFRSETDTEVLAHLIAAVYEGDLKEALRKAIARASGAYALVAMTSHEPGRIVAARMISPLVVGLGDGETFLASDMPAVLDYTRRFLIVEDGEIAEVTRDGVAIETIEGVPVDRSPFTAEWDTDSVQKGGFDHFMLKEIHEQPDVIARTLGARMRGRSRRGCRGGARRSLVGTGRPRRRGEDLDHRLRNRLPRRRGRPGPLRTLGRYTHRGGLRPRAPLQRSADPGRIPGAGHQPSRARPPIPWPRPGWPGSAAAPCWR